MMHGIICHSCNISGTQFAVSGTRVGDVRDWNKAIKILMKGMKITLTRSHVLYLYVNFELHGLITECVISKFNPSLKAHICIYGQKWTIKHVPHVVHYSMVL